jgi:hypothetical protein
VFASASTANLTIRPQCNLHRSRNELETSHCTGFDGVPYIPTADQRHRRPVTFALIRALSQKTAFGSQYRRRSATPVYTSASGSTRSTTAATLSCRYSCLVGPECRLERRRPTWTHRTKCRQCMEEGPPSWTLLYSDMTSKYIKDRHVTIMILFLPDPGRGI